MIGYDEWLAEHRSAQRTASAITLNVITGDVAASLDLLLPLTGDERIAVISALAGDLAAALHEIHGGDDRAIAHLRRRLHYLARAAT